MYVDDRKGFWFYDHVCVAKGTSSSQVQAIHQYHLQEDADLEDEGDVT